MPGKGWSEPVPIIIINPNSTASMTDAMVNAAKSIAPDLQIEGWTSHEGPPAIQGREDGDRATAPLLQLVEKAAASGASGIVIGCFDDTALAEARARVSCPVIGLGQAAYAYCALRGWRFSVVTTLPVSTPILEENILGYGFAHLLGRVRASSIPVLELEASPASAASRILAEAQAAVREDHVDAIVLGCAGMVAVTAALRAHHLSRIVDPIEAAIGGMRWLNAEAA